MILNGKFNTFMFYWTAFHAAYAYTTGSIIGTFVQAVIGMWFIYIGTDADETNNE